MWPVKPLIPIVYLLLHPQAKRSTRTLNKLNNRKMQKFSGKRIESWSDEKMDIMTCRKSRNVWATVIKAIHAES